MTRALLLVGHGSQLSADSAGPVYAAADAIRRMGAFDDVGVAFWKEEPPLRGALLRIRADEIVVVPLLLADGYFNRQVVPRELGLETHPGARYAEPLGTHPLLATLVEERALAALEAGGADPTAADLVVAGHGTPLDPGSEESTRAVTRRLRERGRFRSVAAGFLDQRPSLVRVVDSREAEDVVVVPFFLADGWHTRRTIPDALALDGTATRSGGRTLHYAEPVGTHPRIPEVVVALAREAQGPSAPAAPPGATHDAVETAFVGWLRDAGPEGRTFLQALVRRDGRGGWEVLHVRDGEARPGALVVLTPEQAAGRARRTEGHHHRPLRAAPDLPGGWVVACRDASAAFRVVRGLYPSDPHRWHAWREAALDVTPWEATAQRQSGRYEGVAALSGERLARAVDACCDASVCLRTPLWPPGSRALGRLSGSSPASGAGAVVPCAEACTLFVSFARWVLEEEARPGEPRAAAFEEPRNPRRVRYLARVLEDRRGARTDAPHPPMEGRGGRR